MIKNTLSATFHERDIFAPIAAIIAKEQSLKSIGKKTTKWIKIKKAVIKQIGENHIQGEIIHIDIFGNIITNIDQNKIKRVKDIVIKDATIKNFYKTYSQAKKNELFGIIGSSSSLEISINQASANKVLNCKIKDKVSITLY